MFFSLNKNIKTKSLLVFIIIIIFFIIYHVNNFIFREKIILNDFQDNNKITTTEKYYKLSGQGIHIKKITLNKKEYFMDQNNNFNIELYLFPGMNIFNLKAITESGEIKERDLYVFKIEK